MTKPNIQVWAGAVVPGQDERDGAEAGGAAASQPGVRNTHEAEGGTTCTIDPVTVAIV